MPLELVRAVSGPSVPTVKLTVRAFTFWPYSSTNDAPSEAGVSKMPEVSPR